MANTTLTPELGTGNRQGKGGRTAFLPTSQESASSNVVPFRGMDHNAATSILPTFSLASSNAEIKARRRRKGSYLTATEVERLMKAALKRGRYGNRDQTLILLIFRHGFRLEEALNLTSGDIDWDRHELKVHRSKNGNDS